MRLSTPFIQHLGSVQWKPIDIGLCLCLPKIGSQYDPRMRLDGYSNCIFGTMSTGVFRKLTRHRYPIPTPQFKSINAKYGKCLLTTENRPRKENSLCLIPKQSTDRFSMVNTTDGLGEDLTNIQNFQLGAQTEVLILGNTIRYNDLIQWGSIDAIDGISAKDTMSEERVDLCRALLLQKLSSSGDCVGSVRQIIHKNCYPVCNISY